MRTDGHKRKRLVATAVLIVVSLIIAASTPAAADPTVNAGTVTFLANTDDETVRIGISADNAAGGTVDVETQVNGQVVNTTTVAAGTDFGVTIGPADNVLTGGENTYTVTATNSDGETDTFSSLFVLDLSPLEIYNESAPSQLISPDEVTVRFFTDDGQQEIIQRDVTDGTVELSGIPLDTQATITADDGNDTYYYRRVRFGDPYSATAIYLLPVTEPAAQVNFQLEDETGEFPAEQTTLFIERPLRKDFDGDGTNETRYVPIAGDTFGASGNFPVFLALDERYRLRLSNADGQTRVLGAYTPVEDTTEPLQIGTVTFQATQTQGAVYDAKLIEQDDGSRAVRVVYQDQANSTDDINITVHRQGDDSAVLGAASPSDSNTVVATFPIPTDAPQDVAYEVDLDAQRQNGTLTTTLYVGALPDIVSQFGLDPQLLSLIGWVATVALTGLVILVSPRAAGVVAVVVAGLLSAIGVFAISPLVFALAGSIALLFVVAGTEEVGG